MTRSKFRSSSRSAWLAPACHRQRGDQPGLAPEALGIVAQQRIVRAGARDVELALQLFAPLPDERRRHQHQHALGHAAQQVFLQHHPGLDGLAEPDLVRQQHPAAEPLQYLAYGLHLVGERFDAAQMRQAQQLVEPLRQTEMAEPLPQPIPPTVRPRQAARCRQQGREIEFDLERDVDVEQRQPRQWGRRVGGCAGRRLPRPLRRPGLGRRLRRRFVSPGRHALSGGRPPAPHDRVEVIRQPRTSPPAAGKGRHRLMPTSQSMAFEQRTRRTELVLLRQGQGMQQMIGIGGDVTLRQPLQEYQRPLGAAVQQRRRRRQAQDDRIAGSGANGLFGQRQESILAIRVGEGITQELFPVARFVRRIALGEQGIVGKVRHLPPAFSWSPGSRLRGFGRGLKVFGSTFRQRHQHGDCSSSNFAFDHRLGRPIPAAVRSPGSCPRPSWCSVPPPRRRQSLPATPTKRKLRAITSEPPGSLPACTASAAVVTSDPGWEQKIAKQAPALECMKNTPPSNRTFEMVPGQHSSKPLRTLKSQAGY